ncbi:MAG: hypothetical protein AB8C40_10405 [Gammaproteobacteria bacterium]
MKKEVREKLEILRKQYESLPLEEIKSIGWKDLEKIKLNGKKYLPSI